MKEHLENLRAEALSALELRTDIRGERLTLEQFAALSNLLKK